MVSKTTMNIVIGIMLLCLGSIMTIVVLASLSGDNQASAANAVPASNVNVNTPAAIATPPYTGVFQYCRGSFQVTDLSNGKSIVVIPLYINNTGDKTYSIGTNDWVIEINSRTYTPYISGDFENSAKNNVLCISPGNEGSATFAYLVDHKVAVGSPLKLIYEGLNNTSNDVVSCTIQGPVDQSTTIGRLVTTGIPVQAIDSSSIPATESKETNVKTLADKEPDTDYSQTSSIDSNPTPSADYSPTPATGSTHNIFDYCTWQAQITKKIGEYNKAPENKSYVVVTIKIINTGDQIYTTNSFSWHLKIGEMYYQADSATYDSSLNHMTTDVGPGGKITTKIAFLIEGEPSISDMDLYYDGPGSDGTIHS